MANNTLNNLKTIHGMQKDGYILEILRDIRSLKSQLDDFSRLATNAKKALEIKTQAQEQKPTVIPEEQNEKQLAQTKQEGLSSP